MSARRRSRGFRIGALVAAVTLVLAGGAFAFWSGIGHGGASTGAASVVALSISPGATSDRMYPGVGSDVALEIFNSNPYSVRVGSLSLDTSQGTGGYAVDAAHAACALSALTYTTQSNGGAGWSVPPRIGATNGNLALDMDAAVAMSLSAGTACQGASFTVYVAAGP